MKKNVVKTTKMKNLGLSPTEMWTALETVTDGYKREFKRKVMKDLMNVNDDTSRVSIRNKVKDYICTEKKSFLSNEKCSRLRGLAGIECLLDWIQDQQMKVQESTTPIESEQTNVE